MDLDYSFRAWVKTTARKIRKTEGRGAIQQQAYMLAYWQEYRPRMWANLKKLGAHAAEDYALVLNTRMWDSAKVYERAGMPPTDARQEAEKEWLLLEPEEEETEDNEER